MGRPTIGITSPLASINEEDIEHLEVGRHARILRSLGAEVVILPRGQATAAALDAGTLQGLLFSGGGDVNPTLYGGREDLADNRVDPIRDAGELSLLRRSFAERVPTLCVCRGLQLANIAFGGTLIEDLPTEFGLNYKIHHHQVRELGRAADEPTHDIRIEPGSGFGRVVGQSRIKANSLHHQAIRSLATPFQAAGYADDGVVEAIELRADDFYFFGVQWHPESLPRDVVSQRIYSSFIEAATNTLRATEEPTR